MCIGFAITDKTEICPGYDLFGDSGKSVVPNATSSHLGAMGPLLLIAFLAEILAVTLLVFWRMEPKCELGFVTDRATAAALYPDFDVGRESVSSSIGGTHGEYQTV